MRMNTFPKRQTMTFIVRVWTEYLDEQPPRWRGMVESVDGSERIHFTELAQIADLIRQKTQDVCHQDLSGEM